MKWLIDDHDGKLHKVMRVIEVLESYVIDKWIILRLIKVPESNGITYKRDKDNQEPHTGSSECM